MKELLFTNLSITANWLGELSSNLHSMVIAISFPSGVLPSYEGWRPVVHGTPALTQCPGSFFCLVLMLRHSARVGVPLLTGRQPSQNRQLRVFSCFWHSVILRGLASPCLRDAHPRRMAQLQQQEKEKELKIRWEMVLRDNTTKRQYDWETTRLRDNMTQRQYCTKRQYKTSIQAGGGWCPARRHL